MADSLNHTSAGSGMGDSSSSKSAYVPDNYTNKSHIMSKTDKIKYKVV